MEQIQEVEPVVETGCNCCVPECPEVLTDAQKIGVALSCSSVGEKLTMSECQEIAEDMWIHINRMREVGL